MAWEGALGGAEGQANETLTLGNSCPAQSPGLLVSILHAFLLFFDLTGVSCCHIVVTVL